MPLSVSIVTISQYYRQRFLKVLAKCIKQQDYPNIKEWVIIDTSHVSYYQTENDLTDLIENFRKDPGLPNIVYQKTTKRSIGGWRNESAKYLSGDIIVCMDDDDYYPPQRVSHAVEKLANKEALIAGCDPIFFYDIHFAATFWHRGIGPMHSTNNCMAYWREYLTNHRYDESVHFSEEQSFTNNFTEKMIQLEPEKTVFQFSHDANTYNKKKIIIQNFLIPDEQKYITIKNITPDDVIANKEILRDYAEIFKDLTKPSISPYQVVYYTGPSAIWSPRSTALKGSEQTVKYLATELAAKGLKVVVYGSFQNEEQSYQGVDYLHYYKFRFWDKHQIVILWRLFGCIPFISSNLLTDKLLIDVHDNVTLQHALIAENLNKISCAVFKSNFHLQLIEHQIGQPLKNAVVIPNGVRIEEFTKPIKEKRNPFRLCYCNCYSRGLFRILENIWPIVFQYEPRAELHIYYGTELLPIPELKDVLEKLLTQPGVMDHGRQTAEVINREQHMATFHLYYTDTMNEIDCISIKESLVAGCIPIISNVNVFSERDGIRLDWLPNIETYNRKIAFAIIELMHNETLQAQLREKFYTSGTIISWKQCAEEWSKHL